MPKATIDDVAHLAGVSIKTVSRVVNSEPNVRAVTQERVQTAIAELNYKPNIAARNLASHRSHLIGLVYDDPAAYEIPSMGYVVYMQQGALRACKAAKYDLLIHPCNYREQSMGAEIKGLVEHARPDGIILAAPLSNMLKPVRAIEATGTPLVRVSPGANSRKHLSVGTNDRAISAKMTEYLASLGHKRIAFISGHKNHQAVASRYLGYQDGLRNCGLKFSERLVVEGDNSIGSGELASAKLLSRKIRPTAIFAANDDMAAGVVRVADRLDIDVPQELSVAGFDDVPLARQIHPALTTVRQPVEAMAQRAAQMLIEGCKNGFETCGTDIVPATLQIRDSTGPVPE